MVALGSGLCGHKVSEAQACSLLAAVWEEVKGLPQGDLLPSATVVRGGANLAATGHECRLTNLFDDVGLSARVPVSFVEVGLAQPHAIISMRDYIQTLSDNEKLDVLFMGHSKEDYSLFWKRFKLLQPGHEVFSLSKSEPS